MEAAILGRRSLPYCCSLPSDGRHFEQFIDLMCNYFQGKGGDEPTQTALKEAAAFGKPTMSWLACQAAGKAIRKNSILVNMFAVYEQTRALILTGDPDKDWRAMRRILEDGTVQQARRRSLTRFGTSAFWSEGRSFGRRCLRTGATMAATSTLFRSRGRRLCRSTFPPMPNPNPASWS